jgi:hypothetical protein
MFRGGMVKTLALYFKGQWFEPQRRRFFTPTVVSGLLSFNKPEKVLGTMAQIFIIIINVSLRKKLQGLLALFGVSWCLLQYYSCSLLSAPGVCYNTIMD